jgi:transposase
MQAIRACTAPHPARCRANHAYLRRRGIKAVIPVKSRPEEAPLSPRQRGRRPHVFDAGRCKWRNSVERCFSMLKQFRTVATRYGKRNFVHQHPAGLASIPIWLQDPAS